jgi:hypothetical protein
VADDVGQGFLDDAVGGGLDIGWQRRKLASIDRDLQLFGGTVSEIGTSIARLRSLIPGRSCEHAGRSAASATLRTT